MSVADPRPMGLSKDVTLAVLPRLYMEEVVSELGRRNISTGDVNNRETLVAVLRVVMEKEYEGLGESTDQSHVTASPTYVAVNGGTEISCHFVTEVTDSDDVGNSDPAQEENKDIQIETTTLDTSGTEQEGSALSYSEMVLSPASQVFRPSESPDDTNHTQTVDGRTIEEMREGTEESVEGEFEVTTFEFEGGTTSDTIQEACTDESGTVSYEVVDLTCSSAPEMVVWLPDQQSSDGDLDEEVVGEDSSSEKRPFKCAHCDYAGGTKKNLKQHMARHTGEKPLVCKECGFRTAYRSAFNYHLRTHTGEKPYMCDQCGHRSANKASLRTHMKTHSKTSFKCGSCSYVTLVLSHFAAHVRTHEEEKPLKCTDCDHQAVEEKQLELHMRIHSGEKPFSCEKCPYKSRTKNGLTNHVKTHTGEKPHVCEQCGYRAAQKATLYRHMRTHTGEQPYPCKICGRSCATQHLLETHMKSHQPKEPLVCADCNYRTMHKADMNRHMRTHTGEKPYSCEECGYRATTKAAFVFHTRIHKGEKPFRCQHCDYAAVRKDLLVAHLLRHADIDLKQ